MKFMLLISAIMLSRNAQADMENPGLFGGFRYRFEQIDAEGTALRERHRMKALLGITAQLDQNLSYVFALISGSDDPVSSNQTLGGGASSKSLHIDQAEFSYKLNGPKWPHNISIGGGKMKKVFFQPGATELIWDEDIRPEGLRADYGFKYDRFALDVTLAHFLLEERKVEDDTSMSGVQTKFTTYFSEVDVTLGASLYKYRNLRGFVPLYDSNDSFGNTVDGSGNYATEFNIQELFLLFDLKVMGIPISVFGDLATNAAADKENKAFLYGFSVGKAKKAGEWRFTYNNREVEADSVVGAYTDSDFADGGTNGKGHEVGFKHAVTDKSWLAITHFMNKKPLTGSKDYSRTQMNYSFKF